MLKARPRACEAARVHNTEREYRLEHDLRVRLLEMWGDT